MCGIAGAWGVTLDQGDARRMGLGIQERGPDSHGIWMDQENALTLVHQRLSILDLSEAGHQPMVSKCDRYVLSYNGEIYNHLALRKEIERSSGTTPWRGHSDTETLLACITEFGLESTLERLNGMFAFALWDREKCELILARDRAGEKPLYYGTHAGGIIFGSELKALMAAPGGSFDINRDALTVFMRHGYIPAPHSIFQNVYKLPPAHYLTITAPDRPLPEPSCYWDLEELKRTAPRFSEDDYEHSVNELESLLTNSVRDRMLSDVPLGAFLSGGYDSSLVVALMQRVSDTPVNTYSIGFSMKQYDEAGHARAVAEHLGTRHTELYVSPEDAMNVIPDLPKIYDEPFSDSSQIPTFLVSRLAANEVKVSLSGDGGDELFHGYSRYQQAERLWRSIGRIPGPVRSLSGRLLESLPVGALHNIEARLPASISRRNILDRLPKLGSIMKDQDKESMYLGMISHWQNPEHLVLDSREPESRFLSRHDQGVFEGFAEQMSYLDTLTYLPDDILNKVDRASMAVSLECRVPFLDRNVMEFSLSAPMSMKLHNGQGKRILRDVLYRHLPREMMDRPKKGFSVPIEFWLRGALKDWANDLLDEKRLREDGFFNVGLVRKAWDEHSKNRRRWHYQLWDVLMFQTWLDEYRR